MSKRTTFQILRPLWFPCLCLVSAAVATAWSPGRAAVTARPAAEQVELMKTPEGGIQPQAAVDPDGVTHLVYLKGDPGAADVFYTRRLPGETTWSAPVRVNQRPGSAVATGTIRGVQLAVGRGGRVHVVWFGSDRSLPSGSPANGAPLLYSRLNDRHTAFEPERNLTGRTVSLDGGPSVAADGAGGVYVVWHAGEGSNGDERNRRLWVARSTDDGRQFSREAPASTEPTGACACCSVRAFVDRQGSLYVLYRAATAGTQRDMVLLTSRNRGLSFQGRRLHPWKVNSCPMSSEALTQDGKTVVAGWETQGQVYTTRIDPATMKPSEIHAAPGAGDNRKHPAMAGAADGSLLLVWTEGTGWAKGGSLAWQGYDPSGRPNDLHGRVQGAIPVWGLATVVPRPDGRFIVIY